MNKSILIVICDFLLLSLLSLARFDPQETIEAQKPPAMTNVVASSTQEISDVLALALAEESRSREQLLAQLRETQERLRAQDQTLTERERQLQSAQATLSQKDAEARKLETERKAIEQQYAESRASLETLQQRLASANTEAETSKQRVQSLQSATAQLQNKLKELETSRRAVEEEKQRLAAEKQRLATELQVAEVAKKTAQEQVLAMRSEVETVRTEKAKIQEHATKLAEGVTTLAESSKELTDEIRQNRPLAVHTIFNDFVANRVQADFQAIRTGLLGREISRERITKTVLVTDGSKTYALCHVQDTPLAFEEPGTHWEWLTGNLRRKSAAVAIEQILFSLIDPRIVLIPVTESQARALGGTVYPLSKTPFKFEDVLLVGANEGYYGECQFSVEPDLPQFLRMDRSLVRGLFGKFNPSRGDLVFSKAGELLGIMVNNDYCALLTHCTTASGIRLGPDILSQQTGHLLADMRLRLSRMPFKLQ